MIKLVLLRHGESTWNKENRFTGWTDVDLSERGVQEAEKAGDLERAMYLYSESQWHFKAVNIALALGRLDDALKFYRPIQGDLLPNRGDEPFQGMEDSMYLGLVSTAGNNVGFNRLYGNVLDVGCRDGRFFRLLKR